jgi:hypothetical protein
MPIARLTTCYQRKISGSPNQDQITTYQGQVKGIPAFNQEESGLYKGLSGSVYDLSGSISSYTYA